MKKIILALILLSFNSCSEDDDNNKSSDFFETMSTNTTEDVTDISFFDNNNGVICGTFGYLAKTTDGGNTWTTLNVGVNHSFMSAFMLDKNNFFTGRIGLYKTTNSGNTFSEIGNLTPAASSIFNIYFTNNLTGFITHDGAIKKTTDGGNTWTVKYVASSFYGITDLKFTSQNIGYGSGGTFFDSFNEGQIVKTTDGGETWDVILISNNITSTSFINDNVGFYSDSNNDIFKTTNGGTQWNKIATVNNYYIMDMLFESESKGYIATYEGKILMTTDGGLTWNIIYEKTNVPILKIVKTSNYLFAVGNNGLLIKSR